MSTSAVDGVDLGPNHPLPSEIRAARAYAGMSRKQIGDALGVSAQVVGRWERGKFKRPPASAMLEAIARATKPPHEFQFVVTGQAARPSVTERARLAALRLDGTPDASQRSPGAQDAEGGAQ